MKQPTHNPESVDALCTNTLRFLAVDVVQQAGSDHPGLPRRYTTRWQLS